MTQIKITEDHINKAFNSLGNSLFADTVALTNKAIEIAEAEKAELDRTAVEVNGQLMSRDDALALYHRTVATHDWFLDGSVVYEYNGLSFCNSKYLYTYKERKPKLKLIDWENPLMSGCQVETGKLITDNSVGFRVIESHSIPCIQAPALRLAPPKDATSNWQVYHHGVTDLAKLVGVEIEIKYWDSWNSSFTVVNLKYLSSESYYRIAAYRLTGKLLDGYTDDPSKVD